MSDHITMQLVDVNRTLEQLRAVDRKVRKKSLRKATTAATKVIHKEARRLAPRANGFFRMSLRTIVRMQKDGNVVGRVGQEKNKQFKRKRYKGSNVNKKGYAARIWWLEGGTRRHAINPTGKVLAWTSGKRKGSKGQARFARKVMHPGMRGLQVLQKAMRAGGPAAANAFNDTIASELAKIPAPGDQS
jgi:HK97 gp10 family phage protein